MTLVAVWKFDDTSLRIHAIADTRITGQSGILTDHGPKILPLSMVCKTWGPSGFADRVTFRGDVGFAFAGSTLSALSSHSLANIMFSNLVAEPDTPPPSLDDIAISFANISLTYIQEIGGAFSAVLFGVCPRTGLPLAYEYRPVFEIPLKINVTRRQLGKADVVVIGDQPQRLQELIEQRRSDPEIHSIVYSDAPMLALKSIIADDALDRVGDAVQQAWYSPFKLEIVATAAPITPRPPAPRNAGLFVLGFDILDMQAIGQHRVSMTGR